IARALESAGARPRVVRLAPSPAVLRRTATRRREHRERILREYLARAAIIELDVARVPLKDRRGAVVADVDAGRLLGVLGSAGETLGIARVRAWKPEEGRVVVETPVAADRIAMLVAGRATWAG